MTTRRKFGELSAAFALAALASACGGSGSEPVATPTPPSPPPPSPPPPPPAPGETPSASSLLATLENFAETAARNWNYGGHAVAEPFDANQGWWQYTNTTYEPWLFDRVQAWRMLAQLTGRSRWSALAQSDLVYYESRLDGRGIFMNKAGEDDTKYSYVHAWSPNAAKRQAAFDATVAGWPARPNLGDASLWTEREVWVGLYAAVEHQKSGGGAAAVTRGQAMLDQWDWVCNGRPAPVVSYTKHEGGGPGGTSPTDLVSSPWMSALYFQAAREYAELNPGAARQVQLQASRYFDWLMTPGTRGFYPGVTVHPEYDGLIFPAYLAGGTTIGDAGPDAGNADHALDMAGFCAFALKAKQSLGLPVEPVSSMLAQMKKTAARSFADWTRPTVYLPMYRLTPVRKFNWWTRGLFEVFANGAG